MANITGWGRGTWGQSTFGEPLPVILTAPGAATSALGTVTLVAKANVIPTGQVGTTGAPQAGANGQAIASVPGLVGSVGVLSIEVDGEANVDLTGQEATSAIGTPTIISNNNISVTLDSAVANLGNLVIIAKATAIITDSLLATTNTPFVNVWGEVDDNQNPNWNSITDSQSPNWSDIAA
jgi:hypothetical protein